MSNKEDGCREIDLMDLLKKVFLAWKLILISIVVCIIIVGSVQLINRKSIQKEEVVYSKSELMDLISNEERQEIQEALFLEEQISAREDYFNNSLLMNENPYQLNVVTLHYLINQETELVRDIHSAYDDYISDGGIAEDIIKKLDLDVNSAYLAELIELERDEEDKLDEKSDILIIRVVIPSEEQFAMVLDEIKTAISNYQKVLCIEIGDFDMKLIDTSNSVVVDTDLAEKQNVFIEETQLMRNKLTSIKSGFNENQIFVMTGEIPIRQEISFISIVKKSVILGSIIGLLFGCLLITLKYLFDGKIQSVSEIKSMFKCNVMGTWIAGNNNIDDECYNMIETRIISMCKKRKVNSLIIASTIDLDDETIILIENLINGLDSYDIHSKYYNCIEKDVEAYKFLADCDAVIEIEWLSKSKYIDIKKQMELISEQGKDVLGMILLKSVS